MSDDPVKDVLKMMPYGFYALTSKNDADYNAMVVNWVTQVSFEPRLVAVGLQKSSYTRSVIEDGRVFTLNLFRQEDQDYIMAFTKSRAKRPDKMKEARYTKAPITGCPILDGAAAYLEFEVTEILDIGGDHDIVVGKAAGAGVLKAGEAGETLSLPDIGWSYAG
jgi:flavin reductase (DIM6/NTAB) family NADH-FMN oxidoreductase RutF